MATKTLETSPEGAEEKELNSMRTGARIVLMDVLGKVPSKKAEEGPRADSTSEISKYDENRPVYDQGPRR